MAEATGESLFALFVQFDSLLVEHEQRCIYSKYLNFAKCRLTVARVFFSSVLSMNGQIPLPVP